MPAPRRRTQRLPTADEPLAHPTRTFLGGALHLPKSNDIDRRLVVGGLVFGAGWGLAGFCPGPALVSLGAGQPQAAVFVIAMLAGMGVFELLERRQAGT